MVLRSFVSFRRKFRKVLLTVLLLITVILLIVFLQIEDINERAAEYLPLTNPITYLTDYSNSLTEDDNISEQDLEALSYPFEYKTFDEKHPISSPYSTVIREMFTYLNDLDISDFIEYEEADNLIENQLLDHQYTPFGFKNNYENEKDSFFLASEGQPYDLNPLFYWELLMNQIADGNQVQFTWYDFVNNVEYNNYLRNIHNATNHKEIYSHIDCSFLNNEIIDPSLFKIMRNPVFFYSQELYSKKDFLSEPRKKMAKEKLHEYCTLLDFDISALENTTLENFHPKILQNKVNFEVRPEVYHLQSVNRIFNTLKKPISIGIINIQDNLFKQVFIEDSKTFIGESYVTNGVFDKYKEMMSLDSKKVLSMFEKLDFTSLPPLYTEQDSTFLLQDEDFLFDLNGKITELEELKATGEISLNQENYLKSLLNNYNSHYSAQKKYFTEADEVLNTYGKGFHHDHRFFRSQISANMSTLKISILQGMLKTFTATLRSLGIMGWISHGNMYGWLYNGLPFPYDDDIDFQLPLKHMHLLAENFNQSVLLQDPRFGNGRYFLDFGNLGGRVHGAGTNNIDGRLIDMDTGLYIDITGLAFNSEIISDTYLDKLQALLESSDISTWNLEKDLSLSPLERSSNEFYRKHINDSSEGNVTKAILFKNFEDSIKALDFDRNFLANSKPENSSLELVDYYIYNMTSDQRFAVNKKLGLVTCKNRHFVDVNDYKKLLHTFYQQTPIILPVNYMDLLHREYTVPPQFSFIAFDNHVFQPNIKKWMKKDFMTRSMERKHQKPWRYGLEESSMDTLSELRINKTKTIKSSLTLEETQILLFNMCDFENENTLNLEQFNEVLELINWSKEFYQSEYRFTEISLLNADNEEKSCTSPSYIKSVTNLFNDISEKMIYFEMHGEEKLYKDAFEYLKITERLADKIIYGYDVTQICRLHMFKTMQYIEDSKFDEVEFLGEYNTAGKPIWEIPGFDANITVVDEINHNVYL
ncbi:hypothetical protein QEN19_003815 [Hanseniaspora menglaensis]